MRSVLAGEVTQAQSYNSTYYAKVEVQNADGTWIDVGAALGKNWITNIQISEHRDSPVSSATFTFIQQIGTASLAPLMETSALNVDDAAAYAPLLEVGRLVRCSTATMAYGVALDTSKYREMFYGRIDNVSGIDNPQSWVGPITISCTDSGSWLMDLQVEKAGTEYGTDAGVALETAVQNIINDNIPTGEPAVTLVKTSTSSFNVTTWKQDEGSLLNSLITLVGDSTGEDLRYRYNSSHVSTLQWFNPDRNRVTVDASFTDTNSFIINQLERDIKNIRNAGELTYTDSTTGLTGKVIGSDSTSIGLYRRRFFRMPSSKMIGTGTEAQTVIDNVVHDLAVPPADATITLPYCWFVQLYDRYTFSANNRQFSDAQTFAVSGYTHTIESGKGQTVLTASARVIGAYARWLRQISQTETTEIRIKDFREVARTTTDVNFGWTPSGIIQEQWLYLSTPAQPVGSDPWADLVGAPTYRLTNDTTSYTVPIPSPGSVTYGRLVPIDSNAKNGRAWEFTVQGASVNLIQRATIVSTSATQVVVRVAVANPVAGGDVTIAYAAGGLTVSPATGQTIASASVTTDITTTGSVDFTITRPSGSGGGIPGRVTFTASCAGRVSDTDSVDVPAQDFPTTALVGTIATAQIADAAITAVKIGTAAVETAKLAAGAVDTAALGAAAVTTAKLANLAVTDAILAANAVTTTKITDTAVTSVKIAANTIVAGNIAAGTITTTQIAANTIVAGNIAAGTITGTEIAATTITGSKLVANTITAAQIAAGTITATEIASGTIVAGNIAASTITGAKIAANTISASNIVAGTITATEIAANTITAAKIAAGTITATELAANSVTASKISVSSLSAIAADLGTVTAGYIQNSGNTAAIRMSGTTTLPTTNYIDFTATGASAFLKTGVVQINADGSSSWGSAVVPKTATEARNRCKVYNSTDQTLSNNSSATLTFDSEVFDVGGLHSTASNTDRITIPSGGDIGTWLIHATVSFAANATGTRGLYLQSSTGSLDFSQTAAADGSHTTILSVSAIVSAPSVGDYFYVQAYQNSGGNLNVTTSASAAFCAVHLW